jgi:hypothetical protein
MQAVSPVTRTTEVSLLLHAEVLSNFTSEMPTANGVEEKEEIGLGIEI